MAITTESQYVAARAGGKTSPFQRLSIANQTGGAFTSLYRTAGPLPAQPAIPAAAVVCNSSTDGAQRIPFAMSGANTLYVDAHAGFCQIAGVIEWTDRVIHSGGLNGTLITAQAVNTPALPARAPAAACEWFIETYVDMGATTAIASVAVTFTDATTSTISVTVTGTSRAGRMYQIVPPAGKIIASVQSVTLSVSTTVAGSFGVTCLQKVGITHIMASNGGDRGENLSIPMPAPDVCLVPMLNASTTSSGDYRGFLQFIQG